MARAPARRSDGWLVVIRPDGIVEAVLGGAPPSWVGQPVDRAFANQRALLNELPKLISESVADTPVHRARAEITVAGKPVTVELLLLEAVPIRRTSTPLEPLVLRTLDVFASQAKSADVELSVRFAEGLPALAFVDAEKLAWAIATLVGGALRHVRVGPLDARAARVSVEASWDGSTDDILIRVSDNGPGIPEERVHWLFEANPETGRTAGLALVMVRDVIVAHRGSIDVVTDREKGTTFTLRLPRRVPASRRRTE
jgi:signal transduction histidine kinase